MEKERREETLKQELNKITPLNYGVYRQCQEKWNSIAKPLHGLGRLEDIICQIGAIRENVQAPIGKRCVIVMCADNGVVREGISQSDASVTAVVARNLADGRANVNLMGSMAGVKVIPVNIGMIDHFTYPGVVDCCVRPGTGNIAVEPAMTRNECIEAILVGIRQVRNAKEQGYDLIATGEMGIGNTTTSSALASLILDESVENVTGRGAGLSDEGLARKIQVIKDALKLHCPDRKDPIDMLCKVGGLDIAGMVGIYLGGAIEHVPIVMDGLIAGVAAILAVMIKEETRDYMIASHVGKEPACNALLDRLCCKPVVCADLALGEGTGAVTIFPLLDMAHRVYSGNITFEDIHMEPYQPF